jgi:two-component system NtrC family response regulator
MPRVDFTKEAMEYLQSLPYPGNIRELKNLLERTLLVSGKETLDAEDFKKQNVQPADALTSKNMGSLTLDEIERQRIVQALEQYGGNISQVASALGLSRPALYRRIEKHNITL